MTADATTAQEYAYRVTWSPDTGQHVGLVDEFPALTYPADTPADALAGIIAAVTAALADLHRHGLHPPRPHSVRDYSGKFQVRVGKDRHRRLAERAEHDGKSINALLLDFIDQQLQEHP